MDKIDLYHDMVAELLNKSFGKPHELARLYLDLANSLIEKEKLKLASQ